MMGVNSGRETWVDMVVKNHLGRETVEEYRDQVSSFEPTKDRSSPPIINAPLTHRDTNHNEIREKPYLIVQSWWKISSKQQGSPSPNFVKMKILPWNAKGLGLEVKWFQTRYLVIIHKTDTLSIQELKLENFSLLGARNLWGSDDVEIDQCSPALGNWKDSSRFRSKIGLNTGIASIISDL
ncbi:hypothetical protein V6N13_009885 [Hibiscus sabdariffa]